MGVGGEIRCVDATQSRNIPYISARVNCAINFSIKETFEIWMLSFLEMSKYLT